MDTISDLAVFTTVIECGSMTGAGEKLALSAAAVSKRIVNLETRLGVRLLNRSTRRLSATEEGANYYQRCKAILEDIADAEASIDQSRKTVKGTLRVTTPASFGRRHIAALLPIFLERYPGLNVDIQMTDNVLCMIESGLDLAIRITAPTDADYVARLLAPSRRLLCAAPEYLQRHGEPRELQQLTRHNCLLLSNHGGREQTWRFTGPSGAQTVRVSGNLLCNNVEVQRDAAVAGLGIALESTWNIADDLRAGRLVPVLADHAPEQVGIYAIYPHRRYLSAKVRAFIDLLAEQFGPAPYWDEGLENLLQTSSGKTAARRPSVRAQRSPV